MRLRWLAILIALVVLAGGAGPAWARGKKKDKKSHKLIGPVRKAGETEKAPEKAEEKAEPEEKSKETKIAGAPYPYTGPDTGAGFGFSIIFRDLFNKEGRDTSFSASYTTNQYRILRRCITIKNPGSIIYRNASITKINCIICFCHDLLYIINSIRNICGLYRSFQEFLRLQYCVSN